MDILHLKQEEINEMDSIKYSLAVGYSWNAYFQRNIPFWLNKMFNEEDKKTQGNKKNIDWRQLNPVARRIDREKRIK